MAGEMKGLVKDTAIYGLATIVGRFINWMLVPIYTRVLTDTAEYGIVTNLYAWTGLLLIILTYGMETGFFYYMSRKDEDPRSVYSTTVWSLGVSSTVFVVLGLLFLQPISMTLGYPAERDMIAMLIIIVAMDAFMAIPFSYLRYNKQPWQFAGLRFLFIGLNIAFNLFFIFVCPWLMRIAPSVVSWFYDPDYLVGYIFVSNLIASAVQFVAILPHCRTGFAFRPTLLISLLQYSIPMMLLGIAGTFNKMADKILFPYLFADRAEADAQLGIYGACFKIAVVMVMFTQAFRYAFDPFIFKKQDTKDLIDERDRARHDEEKRQSYAKAMKYYLIFTLFIFLCVMAYLDLIKYFVGSTYYAGLSVVPLVMIGELLFGVYYNLATWYKVSKKTYWGAIISTIGCALTVFLIVWGVPRYGFMACAWASVLSNALMVIISYALGQRHYPIPYDLGHALKYIILTALLYGMMIGLKMLMPNHPIVSMALNTLPLLLFVYYISQHDISPEVTATVARHLPLIRRFFGTAHKD